MPSSGARALLVLVAHTHPLTLPWLGARLYGLQDGNHISICAREWRLIWQAYHARRFGRPA